MLRKLKVLVVWGLISLTMQVGFLFFLEKAIKGDPIAAEPIQAPVIVKKNFTLPTGSASNLQAAYAKDYVAYTDAQGLKVINVTNSKIVFIEAKPPQGRILGYHWLPDRNTLLYVVAKQNPNPKPMISVKRKYNPEDPQSSKKSNQTVPAIDQYYNPQVTELYAVDFADPDTNTIPDNRLASKINDFPAGAKIESMDLSTYTNLIYILAKSTSGQKVFEIDVMKNIRTVQRSGEKVSAMVASDKKGTLYLQSSLYGIDQIVAVKHDSRQQVLKGSEYKLLGVQDNKVLVGEVQDSTLTKIISLPDTDTQENISKDVTVEWQGSVPWENYQAIMGASDYWVLYNQQQAVVFEGGKTRQVKFTTKDNQLTADGREVMEAVPGENNTLQVTIKPL